MTNAGFKAGDLVLVKRRNDGKEQRIVEFFGTTVLLWSWMGGRSSPDIGVVIDHGDVRRNVLFVMIDKSIVEVDDANARLESL